MKRWLLVACLLCGPAEAGVRPLVFLGVGFPELLHAEAGVLIKGRVSIEAKVGWVVFNLQTGLGVTGWFLGAATDRPPRHALLGSLDLRVNPTLQPFRGYSGGETLGATIGAYVGYAFTTQVGLSLRILLGGIFGVQQNTIQGPGGLPGVQQNVTAGPNGTIGVGWIF